MCTLPRPRRRILSASPLWCPSSVYHGQQKWKIRTVASHFEGMNAQWTPFVPQFQYLLNDLSHYSPETLLAMDGS